jgi:hypothetical protein
MQFCPKCDNIMDIGKSAPRITVNVATPDTVSETTEAPEATEASENIIRKLITLYKNKEDISTLKVDMKQLLSYPEYMKLKENDKNNILKLLKSDIDDSMSAYRICKNCSYFEKMVGKTLVLSRMNMGSNLTNKQDLSKYKYMIHDKTLPHTREYVCKNDICITHKDLSKRDAVWFRPSPTSYSTCYACIACNMIWNIS